LEIKQLQKTNSLIALMNSYVNGLAGGDTRFIEVAKRTRYDKVIITSSLGKKLCEERGVNARFLLTTMEMHACMR